MFEDNDVVRAKRDLSSTVLEGSKGTIVMVYDKDNGDYEVEFLDDQGHHLDLLTVNAMDLEHIEKWKRDDEAEKRDEK